MDNIFDLDQYLITETNKLCFEGKISKLELIDQIMLLYADVRKGLNIQQTIN